MSTTELIPSQQSEARRLQQRRAELAQLESEVAQRAADLARLQIELRQFESRYLQVVGHRYDELAEIEREIARMQGLPADDEPTASLADDEVGCGQNRLHSDKLKKLYHEVARKFHPDLTACPQERQHRHQLMIEVNRAYQAGAAERLQGLLTAGASLANGDADGEMSAEMILLVRRIADVQEQLTSLAADEAEVSDSEIYKLQLRVANAEALGLDLLGDLVAQVERQIKKARHRLEHLQGVLLTA